MHRSPLIRIAAALAALSVVFTLMPVASASADVSIQAIPTFTFRGSGWGHGIGMSQYGAQGSALAGKDYRWILGHYYSDTTVAEASMREVKVNIDCAYKDASYPGRPSWTMKAVGSTLKVWRTSSFDPTYELSADTFYCFTTDGTNVIVKTEAGAEVARLPYDVWVAPSASSALLEVKDKSTSTDGAYHPLTSAGLPTDGFYNVRYRGKIWLDRKDDNRLAAVNQVSMQHYLYGVVPRESPSSWEPDALKAQAVAARSYAYADMVAGNILKCTTYSQVYKGHSRVSQGVVLSHEAASTNAAVDATDAQVVKTSTGAVAKTYFCSQSGGHTANNEDVWVGGTPLSYTRGVPDPYEHLANPPYSPWPSDKERTYSGLEITKMLQGVSGVPPESVFVTGISIEHVESGHAKYVNFTFANGAKVRVSGDTVRSRFKEDPDNPNSLPMLSTRFYLTGFPMERIYGNTRYDTAAKVSQTAFPGGAPAAVIACGEDYADALTGSALAGAVDGALLLTASDSLPAATRNELVRLAPGTVYIMGGTAAVATLVEEAVTTALPDATVQRVEGSDRYQTARRAADLVASLGGAEKAIVVSSTGWADAAAASALAYARAYPILLTRTDSLDGYAAGFLAAEKPGTTVLVGGTAVLSTAVEDAVADASGGLVERDGGYDRYQTAARLAERCLSQEGFGADALYVATGASYADALTGGTLAGAQARPLLLTQCDTCPVNTAAFLDAHNDTVEKLWLFGGEAAISASGLASLDMVMMR